MKKGKDWTGNKRTAFATLGASNHSAGQRQENDFYATEPSVIDALFEVEQFYNPIWECACGMGHLSERMLQLGRVVVSTDLYDRGYGTAGFDFLNPTPQQLGEYSGIYDIITNPPFRYSQEFVLNAISLAKQKVAMFLRIQFLEGKGRDAIYDVHPPKMVYVFKNRAWCAQNGNFEGKPNSAACYAWFVWDKNYCGDTIVKRIELIRKDKER